MTGAAPEEVTLRYEMAFTPAEFHRLLPAVAAVEFDAALNEFSHVDGERRWRLRLVDPRQRTIATLRLPVVDVVFAFQGHTDAEINEVLERFFTYFRRGGG